MAVARRLLGVFASCIICSLPLAAQPTVAIRGRLLDSASSHELTVTTQAANTATAHRRLAPQPAVLTERITALRRLPVSVVIDCPFHH